MYSKIKHIHFVGIGGIGMSGIAELLSLHGYRVSGSDLKASSTLKRLESIGIKVFYGHHPQNAEGTELLVHSSAIQPSNPEITYAKQYGIPVIPRAEMLAELMRLKYGIAVAGAHGKTTTTSMIAMVLTEAGLDPTIVVGGRMDNFGGTNARLGKGDFIVVEADESDGSFNQLTPSIAVVTNMDREHMEYYKTMRRLKSSFLSFMNKVPFYGLNIFNGDDPYLRLLRPRLSRRKSTFGGRASDNYRIQNYVASSEGCEGSVRIGTTSDKLKLRIPGKHNLYNAVAALAVADELDIPRKESLKALRHYQGVQRRLQKKGEIKGVLYIDDYAHHPTEIRVTLSAVRDAYPEAKLYVVFQPHRYSRVEDLFHEFSTCFEQCNGLWVTEVYAAGEAPTGLKSEVLVDNMHQRGIKHANCVETAQAGIIACQKKSRPGDIILTLGAGDIPNVYKDLFPPTTK